MAFAYIRSWLSGFDPPSFRYAIRLAKLHDRAFDTAVEFGKTLSAVGLKRERDPAASLAHFGLSTALTAVTREFRRLKLPASQGLGAFRDSFTQLLHHLETLTGGEWNRLANTMASLKPMTEDESIKILDAASGLLAGISIWSEEIKTASHTFLNLNKRV
ncbi:MAG: hypothetical protein QOC81_3449 [Thermoanaerobaculia bacterium]|jgi:hypothetical protein|nr:hypothetical protein [Thermoanaerobaculia bacterium]